MKGKNAVMNTPSKATVLLTDYAWPDVEVERGIIEDAGFRLLTGPSAPASEQEIDALVLEHRPDAIMTCWARVSARAIRSVPNLRIVARMGVGLDNIAVDAATARGAWVTNVPDYCTEEVSDHAVSMVLAWARGLIHFSSEVRQGRWNPAAARLRRVSTLTCGIVGYGRIGRRTAGKLGAFGARVVVLKRPGSENDASLERLDLEELLRQSDVVIIHVPLNEQTHHLIDARRLSLMKQDSMLVNVSRGGIVDIAALTEALAQGRLEAVGLDVLEHEPDMPEALRGHPSAILTPHIGFSSESSLLELRMRASEEVVRALRGEPLMFPCNAPAAMAP